MTAVAASRGWIARPPWLPLLLDATVLGMLGVVIASGVTSGAVTVVVFVVVLAAFSWGLDTFPARGVFWAMTVSVVVVGAALTGRLEAIAVLDVAFLVVVLGLIHTLTSRRAAAANEVERLLAEERDQVSRLLDLAELKADFTAMVVHEFGNPLAALRRLNEMMRLDGLDAEARAFVLESTRTELGVLDSLVADVAATVAVEREDFRIELRAVEVVGLLDGAETFGRSVCARHVFSVRAGEEVGSYAVLADADRIAQVLRNLISNAAKYSPPGSAVAVRAIEPAPGVVRFEVADEGRGITPDDLERVFEKYGRADSTSGARVAGVGLGLYICRRLLRSHGSDLTLRSGVGRGSVFGFDLERAGVERS